MAHRCQRQPWRGGIAAGALLLSLAAVVPRANFSTPEWQASPRCTNRLSHARPASPRTPARSLQVYDFVQALFPIDGEWYPGQVVADNKDGTFEVRWEDADSLPEASTCAAADIVRITPRTPLEEFRNGQKLKGTVVRIMDSCVVVDVGAERTGTVALPELVEPLKRVGAFHASDRVAAISPVCKKWCRGTVIEASSNQVRVAWDDAQGAASSSDVPHNEVRHILPAVGHEIEVCVMNAKDGRLQLSTRQKSLAALIGLHPEEWLVGRVVLTAPRALTVDVIPPSGDQLVRGFVHLTCIRDGIVKDARNEARVGQKIQVRVMEVNLETASLHLSMLPPAHGALS